MKEKQNQAKVFDMADTPIKRSTFDLSFPNKMTLNFNKIYPTLFKKTMAGDSWTIKTSMFSRWLGMKAPTFSEYSIRENCAYVSCNQLWGGFQQFIAQGDDQAAQYLLPGTTSNFQNFPQPYFTTKELCRWFARKIFTAFSAPNTGESFQLPQLTEFAQRFFRMFVVPVIGRAWDSTHQAWNITNSVDSDPDFLNLSGTEGVHYVVMLGSVLDNNYWDYVCQFGEVVEITKWTPNDTNILSQIAGLVKDNTSPKIAFVPYGSNKERLLSASLGVDFTELPKWYYIPSVGHDYDKSSQTYGGLVAYSSTKANWENYQFTRYIPHTYSIIANSVGAPNTLKLDTEIAVITVDSLAPSETMTSTSVYNALSHQDIFERTLGQRIIYQLMGAGTLTDYLGKPYSQSLLRQPFPLMNYLLGFYNDVFAEYGSWNHDNVYRNQFIGTYNENSWKYDVGVVNDVKIAFMPYLAYHKIWNDYIRDNRYELRFLYSDPYRSPFMQPLYGQGNNNRNGSYCQGALVGISALDTWDNYGGIILYGVSDLSNPSYFLEDSQVQTKLTPTAPFSLDSICELLTLRERRVVHDFFTMVTPTAQYGNEAVANVSSNTVSTVAMRMASRLQKFLERSNFVGSDYVKQTLAHWGVTPSHCQHCSSRYLGGKVLKPTISPVTQTSSDNYDSGQSLGNQSAQMYCSGNFGKVHFETNEFGYVMQLVTIQNDFFTTEGQELDPIYPLDYPYPIFGDLGPEALPLARVVQTDNTPNIKGVQTHPLSVFGYIPRYAQWKCSLAEVHGDFRKSLSYWVSKRQLDSDLFHGSYGFGKVGNIPQVGKAFLYENPDYNAFVYDGEEFDHALLDLDHQITVSRELPMLPTPNVL